MARCSCAGNTCGCQVTQGAGVVVEGQGTAAAPYVISIGGVNDALTHTSSGPLDLSGIGSSSVTSVSLGANVTDVLLPPNGVHLDVILTQDATGGRTVNWPDAIAWPGGTEPTTTPGANASDWYTLVRAGAVWMAVRTGTNIT